VLDDFSIKITAGEKIGLVGESGSGKSTVAQLLMRMYEPISGEILIDGHNIREYDLYHLRRSIGVVSQ
jgi:ABC-type multidrug transport system fused ATPase/permease subunit